MTERARGVWRYLSTAARMLLRRPLLSVVVIPVLQDGRVVLVRRADSGLWSLPGGFVDWGESVREAGARELREETGLEVSRLERLQGVYSDPRRDPRTHVVSVTLVAQVRGSPRVGDALELREVSAFSPDQLPLDALAHDHGEQLRDHLAGRWAVF